MQAVDLLGLPRQRILHIAQYAPIERLFAPALPLLSRNPVITTTSRRPVAGPAATGETCSRWGVGCGGGGGGRRYEMGSTSGGSVDEVPGPATPRARIHLSRLLLC